MCTIFGGSMRIGRPLLLFLSLLGMNASEARAQSRIEGVLFDSLRIHGPIASGEVILLGTGRRTTTDRRGRFAFADVAPGDYRVGYWAHWLDSVALPALERPIRVEESKRPLAVVVSTPSPATYGTARCGGPLVGVDGIMLGEVRSGGGEPIAGIVVTAQWTETLIAKGHVERRDVMVADTTSASGAYVLCGVPMETEVGLRAGNDELGSGEIIHETDATMVNRRDLVAGGPLDRTRLRGQVQAPDGSPLPDARIVVIGDTATVTSGAQGQFTIEGLPLRSSQLVVRAIGYLPATVPVDPLADRPEVIDVRLERAPRDLPMVNIHGRVLSREERDFEHRRVMGLGHFLDEETLRRVTPAQITALVYSRVVRSRYVCSGGISCTFLLVNAKGEPCVPRLYVDGVDTPDDQHFWLQRAVRIEVYRAAFAPPQFQDHFCGSLVIWTR